LVNEVFEADGIIDRGRGRAKPDTDGHFVAWSVRCVLRRQGSVQTVGDQEDQEEKQHSHMEGLNCLNENSAPGIK
jgi:hypothetical protein